MLGDGFLFVAQQILDIFLCHIRSAQPNREGVAQVVDANFAQSGLFPGYAPRPVRHAADAVAVLGRVLRNDEGPASIQVVFPVPLQTAHLLVAAARVHGEQGHSRQVARQLLE